MVLIYRDLALLSSFNTLIPINVIGYLQLVSFCGGIILMVGIRIRIKGKKANLISLITVVMFITLTLLVLLMPDFIDGEVEVILRLISNILLPIAFSGVYLSRVKYEKTFGLEVFRILIVIANSMVLMIGIALFDFPFQFVYLIIYITGFIFTAIFLAVNQIILNKS
ncbi:MAG: hypothetical protein EU551_04040 [Promethearchaeota archaeon]|nr:MAG: hypothetical protein EU551_04040 [Candidatus Lokiarchaeota archaeon]